MSERPVPATQTQRERQRRALTKLREASGQRLTPLAAQIGVSSTQLGRYISGETILPPQMYDAVAATFGIRRIDLIIRLGMLDDPDEQITAIVAALKRAAEACPKREQQAEQAARQRTGS